MTTLNRTAHGRAETADSPPTNSVPLDFALSSYDFPFSEALIADRPAEPRDASRMMVLDRTKGSIAHDHFHSLPKFLRPGDCMVLNRTKVWPARLVGRKSTGGKVEMLLVREVEPGKWAVLSSDVKAGTIVAFQNGASSRVLSLDEGEWICEFNPPDVESLMKEQGLPPLPPYILKKRKKAASSIDGADREKYQTVFAKEDGSIAAPTAGFHFTPGLLEKIRAMGVVVTEITLHVGHGTFKPVTAEDIRQHRMKREWYNIPKETTDAIQKCRAAGGRIITVGTTATRSLESHLAGGPNEGWTDLFIHPGFKFRAADNLITNFHFPRSTPLLLASAFAGRPLLFEAYRQAVEREYRLYSYGDAMLIL